MYFASARIRCLALVVLISALCCTCAPPQPVLTVIAAEASCRVEPIQWRLPGNPLERMKLDDWCRTVGPPVIVTPRDPAKRTEDGRIVVISWNVHVGHGDVERLTSEITAVERQLGRGNPDFVMLLQEAFRQGDGIPSLSEASRVPGRISPPVAGGNIREIAERLGWWLVYIPSMRNGRGFEDRGNAILSSMPLTDPEAVELPFGVQRRVAVAATVTGVDGRSRFRVASLHLDTVAPFSRGWFLGGPSIRRVQAEATIQALSAREDGLPLVIGGDLNTPAGIREPAAQRIAARVPRQACGERPTYRFGLRLDHLFARVPAAWVAEDCVRLDDRYDSDHHPLVMSLAGLVLGTGRQGFEPR